MMAAPSPNPLGLGRPSTSAGSSSSADPPPPALDQLTEEQVFGTRKKRYHAAQDPIESSLNTSQHLLLSQSLAAQPLPPPPPPPQPIPIPPSSQLEASTSARLDRADGGVDGLGPAQTTARIPIRAKAKKGKLDFNPQPVPSASAAAGLSSSTAKRPSPTADDDEQLIDRQLGGASGAGGVGGAKRARIDAGGEAVEGGGLAGLDDEVRGEREKRKKVLSRAPKKNLLQFLPPPPPPIPRPTYALSAPPPPASHPSERTVDSTMPLQISDTPMIRRNQAMRAGASSSASGSSSAHASGSSTGGRSSSGQRKSSFGKRGNRASASFGEGRASAPHASIPTAEFYRHVEADLPEAVRMRHLLVFLGKRLAKGKGKEDSTPAAGVVETERERVVRETKDEVLRALIGAKCDTNPCGGHKGKNLLEKPTRPHPGNVENRRVSEASEAFIKKGKAEEALWSQAVKAANALQTQTCAELAAKQQQQAAEAAAEAARAAEAEDAQVGALLEAVLGAEAASAVDVDDLEFHIDTIHQVTQTAVQLSLESATLLDGLFQSLTALLRSRSSASHRPPPSASALADAAALANGPGNLVVPASERQKRSAQQLAMSDEVRRVLRLLAEKEGKKPTLSVRAAVDELAALPPPPPTAASTSSGAIRSTTPPPTGLSASLSAKPAKAGGALAPVTPRKGTATPRKGTGTTPFRARTPGGAAPPQAE